MVLSLMELFRIGVIIVFLGYIFMDGFRELSRQGYRFHAGFDWKAFEFAALVTAPAVILHELFHKFSAMAFGMIAEFYAAYLWLFLGVALKLMGVGAIFFIPGYVAWGCPVRDYACQSLLASSPWIGALIGFAGPFANLLLWQGAKWYRTNPQYARKKFTKKYYAFLFMTERINMFLFFFNLIPIPPFDGFHVVTGILETIF
jgi:Zn-dependent protease